jgi:hypothetical protein
MIKMLAELIELKRKEKGGTDCPCCKQHVQEYPRPIHSGMARVLIAIYRADVPDGGWLHISIIGNHSWTGDYAKLRYWGLLESKPNQDPHIKEKKDSGLWRITEKGKKFARGEIKVRKTMIIFRAEVLEEKGELVSIHECLSKKFDYQELMWGTKS